MAYINRWIALESIKPRTLLILIWYRISPESSSLTSGDRITVHYFTVWKRFTTNWNLRSVPIRVDLIKVPFNRLLLCSICKQRFSCQWFETTSQAFCRHFFSLDHLNRSWLSWLFKKNIQLSHVFFFLRVLQASAFEDEFIFRSSFSLSSNCKQVSVWTDA